MLLMCKNTPVYDIVSRKILNRDLIPGAMLKAEMSFERWTSHRKSVLSNVIARRVYFDAFGYEAEEIAEQKTHILSLSDCYWLKYGEEKITFEEISPYHNKFWTGTGLYAGGAVPTIYTSGAVSKYWIDHEKLYKKGCTVELEAYKLAVKLGIRCNKVEEAPDKTGIIVHNITNADVMLEPAICSGAFKGSMFPTIDEVVLNFGESGLVMLAFDAVIGNVDRHLENLGFLRDSNTGEYLGMAPLYDFDHTLSANGADDYLIKQLPYDKASQFSVIEQVCKKVLQISNHPVFRLRAHTILEIYNLYSSIF